MAHLTDGVKGPGNNVNSVRSPLVKVLTKAPTGITGFDEITGGGLPRGRTTLLVGGPGSGKTILALQFLVHGAQHCKEPGIFVAFEETSKRIVANAESFGWKLAELRRNRECWQFRLQAKNRRRNAVVDQAHFLPPKPGKLSAMRSTGRQIENRSECQARFGKP